MVIKCTLAIIPYSGFFLRGPNLCELCETLWARRFYNRRHYCWAEKLCKTLWARRFYNRRHNCWAEKLYVRRNCASQKKPAIRYYMYGYER